MGMHQVQGWTADQVHGYSSVSIGSIFASMEFISCRKLQSTHSILLTASVSSLGGIASSIILGVSGDAIDLASLPLPGWFALAGVSTSGFVAVQLLNMSAQRLEAGPVSVIGITEIAWAYLLQIIMFHDVPSLLVGLGAVLVLVGGMLPGIQQMLASRQSAGVPVCSD